MTPNTSFAHPRVISIQRLHNMLFFVILNVCNLGIFVCILLNEWIFKVLGRVNSSGHWRPYEWWLVMVMTAKWYSGTLGAWCFLTFVFRWGKTPRNLTQETCSNRGSNPGPLRDKRACYHLAHSGGLVVCFVLVHLFHKMYIFRIKFN